MYLLYMLFTTTEGFQTIIKDTSNSKLSFVFTIDP